MGIALGPTQNSFSTSADYFLDRKGAVGNMFPPIQYDGELFTSRLSNRADTPPTFAIGDQVFVLDESDDVCGGTVESPPTTLSRWYTVRLKGGGTINVDKNHIFDEHTVSATGIPSTSLGFFSPGWLKQDAQVTVLNPGIFHRGFLVLDKNNLWQFVTRRQDGRVGITVPLVNIPYSWKARMQENSLALGWQDDVARRVCGYGRHVSAANLWHLPFRNG